MQTGLDQVREYLRTELLRNESGYSVLDANALLGVNITMLKSFQDQLKIFVVINKKTFFIKNIFIIKYYY